MRPIVPCSENESGIAKGTASTDQDRGRRANGQTTSTGAFDIHVKATACSAVYGHPGFVPRDFLASLTGSELGHPDARLPDLAPELCAAGVWAVLEGGYRVLDDEAALSSLDELPQLMDVLPGGCHWCALVARYRMRLQGTPTTCAVG